MIHENAASRQQQSTAQQLSFVPTKTKHTNLPLRSNEIEWGTVRVTIREVDAWRRIPDFGMIFQPTFLNVLFNNLVTNRKV